MSEFGYHDDRGRLRSIGTGRFMAEVTITPDEVCPNGCERFGDWWFPEDCATHLVGAR